MVKEGGSKLQVWIPSVQWNPTFVNLTHCPTHHLLVQRAVVQVLSWQRLGTEDPQIECRRQ